jgi:DNA-binding CsgD family transcriptional regulator
MNYQLAQLELLPLMKDGKTNKEIAAKYSPSLKRDAISWYRSRFIKDNLLDKKYKMLIVRKNGNTKLRTKLSSSAQQILDMHKEGKTVEQIVATIHKTEDAVKSSLYRLKQKGALPKDTVVKPKVTIPKPTIGVQKTINFLVNGVSVIVEAPAKVISIGRNRFTIDF